MWENMGTAVADWHQSRVNIAADELRGCHQWGCDQPVFVCHCVGVFPC